MFPCVVIRKPVFRFEPFHADLKTHVSITKGRPMGIFKKINDIISANLNDLTDSWENPEQMLRQAIREMEESIGAATRETARALANEKLLGKELEKNRSQARRWEERAEQAVSAGDDELARKALKRKKE